MVSRRSLLAALAWLACAPAFAAAVTGTPSVQVWGTTANPAGQNVTVPADAVSCYWFWSYFAPTNGAGLASATLGGNAGTAFEVPMVSATFEMAVGVVGWISPSTGTLTLDPAWDAAPTDGPNSFFACVNDADTGATWRDADGQNGEAATALSVTLTTVSGDLVLKHDSRFNAALPGTTASWTSVQTQTNNNSLSARLSSIVATGTTQVAAAENEDYSGMVAISIQDGAGGGGASPVPKIMQQVARAER